MSASRFVEANGLRLHYLEQGAGAPLVLVPGLTANAHSFDGLLTAGLADGLRILAFDARGRGLSDTPAEGYTIADHAVDVLAALDALGLDRVALGGHSFGGLLAYHLAAHHPERVERAIILDAPFELDLSILDQIAPSLARLDRTFASWAEYDAFVRSFPYWDGFSWSSDVQAYYRGDALEPADGTVRARCRRSTSAPSSRASAVDWRATLAAVACPTLLIRRRVLSARPAPGRSSRPRAHGAPSR